MIDRSSFQKMVTILKLSHFFLFLTVLISVRAQPAMPLYSADYLLLPQARQLMIPINNSLLIRLSNGTMQYLKATVKIQLRALNGTYIDAPFQTGNILVKYWKNQPNTLAQSVLSYSYQSISSLKKITKSTDPTDSGLFDIQSLHNYQNQHNFIHSYGNQLSDVLFVLGVYRYGETNLTDLFKMSTINDEIKISISVFKAVPSELKCSFCSVKTFCPTNQCQCYQENYSDCRLVRKNIVARAEAGAKVNDSLVLRKGTMMFVQIEPDTTSVAKEWYLTQVLMSFDDVNGNGTSRINTNRIFFLSYIQNKTEPSYMIANIYNYNSIDSPSLPAKITSQPISQSVPSSLSQQTTPLTGSNLSNSTELTLDPTGIYIYQKSALNKNQILTMAIYYLNDTDSSSTISPDNQANELNVQMEMTFGASLNNLTEGTINLALVIGMIALGFAFLLLLVCVLHFVVAKRFSVFSIFANSESNRTSIYSGRPRSRKIANLAQEASTLPEITFDFMKQLIFKPLKSIYTPQLHKNSPSLSPKPPSTKLTPRDQLCSICLQQFTPCSLIKYTYCGHILDSKCLQSWFSKQWSCPMCRQKLQREDVEDYEDKIMAEVWENEYFQGVVDREVDALRRLYKCWETRKQGIGELQGPKYTEESLVENVPHKYIQNTIHNISTMQELQKTTQPITVKKSSYLSSPDQISLQTFPSLIQVFQSNQTIPIKRFIRIYRFYRCVYLYHQINKKFDRDQNLFQGEVYFQEKDVGKIRKEERVNNEIQLEFDENYVDHDALYVTTRKCMVKEREEQQQGRSERQSETLQRQKQKQTQQQQKQQRQQLQKRQQLQPRYTRYRYQEQSDLQTNFNTSQKLKSTQSFKRIKNNKQGRAAFHLDFQFNQLSQQQQNPNNNHHDLQSIENSLQNPLVLQPQSQPMLIRQATDSSQQSHSIKIIQQKRTKVMSMREEMEGLEREFASGGNQHEKKSDQMTEEIRFREHESIVFFEDIEEDARYVEVLSPVLLSTGKLQSRREQKTNREQITSSVHMSRKTIQPSSQGKKSSLGDDKKVQTPPNS